MLVHYSRSSKWYLNKQNTAASDNQMHSRVKPAAAKCEVALLLPKLQTRGRLPKDCQMKILCGKRSSTPC